MKNILVIGATGQIGSELTLELRKRMVMTMLWQDTFRVLCPREN